MTDEKCDFCRHKLGLDLGDALICPTCAARSGIELLPRASDVDICVVLTSGSFSAKRVCVEKGPFAGDVSVRLKEWYATLRAIAVQRHEDGYAQR